MLTKLAVYFYTFVLLLIGAIMIGYALDIVNISEIAAFFDKYADINVKFGVGIVGLLIILFSVLFSQIVSSKIKREKTIAFQTQSGEVLISLEAVEDLIKKLIFDLEGIRDVRPNVIATKKGIEVNLRVSLAAEANIPEFTGRMQELIKSRIQEILGVDEAIIVKIFVAKIVIHEDRSKKRKESKEKDKDKPSQEEQHLPFHGYKR